MIRSGTSKRFFSHIGDLTILINSQFPFQSCTRTYSTFWTLLGNDYMFLVFYFSYLSFNCRKETFNVLKSHSKSLGSRYFFVNSFFFLVLSLLALHKRPERVYFNRFRVDLQCLYGHGPQPERAINRGPVHQVLRKCDCLPVAGCMRDAYTCRACAYTTRPQFGYLRNETKIRHVWTR